MLKITVSIETQLPKAEFYTLARNKHYRIKTANQSVEWIPVPEKLFSDFQHQFENVGTREKQNKRKKALSAIVQAAYHGMSVKGATLYSTLCPCLLCTKMLINSGIAEVVYSAEYPMGELSLELLKEARLNVRQWPEGG